MKKLLFKYLFLIVLTFFISILIYNYIESFKPIENESDVLKIQEEKEKEFLKNTSYTIDNPNIILNPYGNSPLSALVVFETNDLTTPTITLKGKNGNDLVHTFTPSKLHILPIYGLYSDYENKVIIEASEKKKEITIKTDKLPTDFPKISEVKKDDIDEFFFTSFKNSKYTAAYDSYGEVRWYLDKDYNWDVQRLNNGHLLLGSNKTINKNYSVSLSEIDLLGKVYFEYAIPGGYHHDNVELTNGNILLITSLPGSLDNSIVEIDRKNGEIVKEFKLKNLGISAEITSIDYDSKTNSILMSITDDNKIISVDYYSLELNYIIGKDTINKQDEFLLKDDSINKPESINSLDDGKFSFVNEIDGTKYLMTYKVNYGAHTYDVIDSIKIGKYENASVSDVTVKDETVEKDNFSIIFDRQVYNCKNLPLYANDLYTLDRGVRLGKLGISETIKDYLLLKTNDNTKIIDKYNIKLYKDVYGLKVSGNFSKKDKVEIILDNVLDKKAYKLITNDTASSRYINEDGIKGKYYIYFNINGEVYKLYKYVTFK
ncbi:MAG: aryl-sulfate sulfotransferase [Bacilli bacterium]|nr:aryl-sulfate sulfotransferase [Bacilli bacterium]